jgi:hypothetical protein
MLIDGTGQRRVGLTARRVVQSLWARQLSLPLAVRGACSRMHCCLRIEEINVVVGMRITVRSTADVDCRVRTFWFLDRTGLSLD